MNSVPDIIRDTHATADLKRKLSLDDLAIFGGPHAFQRPLHIGQPNIGNREVFLRRMKDILDARLR